MNLLIVQWKDEKEMRQNTIFYALLSGAIPFENSNPLELNKNLMYFVMILSILY